MKNIITILAILLTVFCTSCKKDNISAGEHEPSDGGIELAISLAGEFEMGSRSALTSSEPMHHIEHMYAYVFAVKGETGITVDNAECVYEEKLPWTATAEGATVFRCRMRPGDEFFEDKNKEYLVMVVATDNNKDTYTFPWSDGSSNADIHLGMTGRKLSEVKMALATSAEPEQMAYTEVFAGFRKFTTSESLINVKLTRRVAGVICYLTDIPAKINDYHIIGAELHWSGGLNKSGVLKPGNLENDEVSFAVLDSDEKVDPLTTLLAKINLKEMGAEADGDLLYIPAINQEGVLKTLPNTAFMGAYMLPVKTGGQFIIKLVGEKRDVEGNVDGDEYVFKDTDTDGYYTVNNSSSENSYTISADYIYNIGYKPYTTDTDYDAPLSLKGKSFVVKPSEWNQDIEVDVDFSDTQLGIMFDTGKTADFRYDCASTTDNTLSIKVLSADYEEKKWTLTTVDGWLHFIDDAGNAVQTISGTGEKEITIKVDDYIEDRIGAYNPDEDFRTATVTLTVADTPISSTSYIRQWNALIVPTVNEDGESIGNIAFRRLDNGAVFKNDGTVDYTNVKTYQWATEDRLPSLIFGIDNKNTGDSGLENYNNMLDALDWNNLDDHWNGCVINMAKDGDWYLPARIELLALMYSMRNEKSANLQESEKWWSATCRQASRDSRYYAENNDDKYISISQLKDLKDCKNQYGSRSNYFRARLAHQIP